MNERQSITSSNLEVTENKIEIKVDKKIYIDCICGDIEHIGRVVLSKFINKKDNTSSFCMRLETNAKSYIKKYHIYNMDGWYKITLPFQFLKFLFSDILERLSIVFAIIFKNTLYVPLDWEIDDNTILDFADNIKKSYNDINNFKKENKNV